ncbi:hypothetical protein FOXB_17349 [Fusarium oxysporum f. sp. conglutinans Fo5176]|uniref:Uncharacterized protein n=1 Tax=Fusarium oxysporum (strain Fo5176) TaxID=660025 RepID=F9GFB5_FUSOF|nr:hypothetical protein FOXB_17349 [Fusarium oxysporum f. sp. conglutinans Fo5176]
MGHEGRDLDGEHSRCSSGHVTATLYATPLCGGAVNPGSGADLTHRVTRYEESLCNRGEF